MEASKQEMTFTRVKLLLTGDFVSFCEFCYQCLEANDNCDYCQ